jgi:hypothetical protein
MVTLYSLYVGLLLLTGFIDIALAAYAWRHRATQWASLRRKQMPCSSPLSRVRAARSGRGAAGLALIEGSEREHPQLARRLRVLVDESRFLGIVTAAKGSRDGR